MLGLVQTNVRAVHVVHLGTAIRRRRARHVEKSGFVERLGLTASEVDRSAFIVQTGHSSLLVDQHLRRTECAHTCPMLRLSMSVAVIVVWLMSHNWPRLNSPGFWDMRVLPLSNTLR